MTFTERLFQKTNIRSFYSRHTQLRKMPNKPELRGLCPLHDEKTPSFHVNLESGSFKCFGCGEGGGPIQYEANRQRISTEEAVKWLAKEYGLKGGRPRSKVQRPKSKAQSPKSGSQTPDSRNPTPSGEAASPPTPNGEAVYRFLLDSGRPLDDQAVAFFARRSIRPETLDRFQVAFLKDPAHTGTELRRLFDAEVLLASGAFLKTRSGNLRFVFLKHPLLFPIVHGGRPVYLQGRLLDPLESAPKYCNLAGMAVPGLFNADRLQELQPRDPVYLCEGAPDTMILEQEGFPAVGVVGSGGFKPEWIPQLQPFKVHLALDNDTAGQSGAERIQKMFHERELPVRQVALPEEFKDVNDLVAARSAEAFRECAEAACLHVPDLRTVVRTLRRRVLDRSDDFDLPDLGERIYRWFESNGGMFFCDRSNRTFLMYGQGVYRIGDNDEFNGLMLRLARLLPVQRQSRAVWSALHTFCVLEGRRQTTLNWSWADHRKGELYLNLHTEAHQVVRLSTGQAEVFTNGDNPAGVLLGQADKMEPIEFDPEADPRQAVQLLKELVIDALACSPEHRLFVTSWLLTAFFLDFTDHKALLKLSGATRSGKSTGALILVTLLYGGGQVERPTVAASYTDASRNPVLVWDNLENAQLTENVTQFLLGASSGVQRSKRKAGTDTGVVREPVQALVALTAIEPLHKSELINRTYEVVFDSLFKQPGFMQNSHLRRLARHRNRILSGLLKLFAVEVLPGLESNRRALVHKLEAVFPGHSKERANSHLSLLLLILRALLKLLESLPDPDRRCWELLTRWIEYQDSLAGETEKDTNPGTYLLDALAHEVRTKGSEMVDKLYYVKSVRMRNGKGDLKQIHLIAPARDLFMAFEILARTKGLRLPFSNARQLMARLSSEREVLAQSGWKWKSGKTVRGFKHHRFIKEMGAKEEADAALHED